MPRAVFVEELRDFDDFAAVVDFDPVLDDALCVPFLAEELDFDDFDVVE